MADGSRTADRVRCGGHHTAGAERFIAMAGPRSYDESRAQ